MNPNRTVSRLLVPVLAVLALLGVMSPASAATNPDCGITWGSQVKQAGQHGLGLVSDLRAGRHACFDRLVIDIGVQATTALGYRVGYVPQVISGPGALYPLRGAADLRIDVLAGGSDAYGNPSYNPPNSNEAVNVAGFDTFRQVVWGGMGLNESLVGLGVRAHLPFRVFVLPGSPFFGVRLVVDVAHHW